MMNYCMNFGAWNGVFAVPCNIVDEHIKLAGAVQLKVILWILRQGGKSFSPEEIAQGLHLPVGDVTDAMNYWVASGILVSQDPQPENKEPFSGAFFEPQETADLKLSPKPTAAPPRRAPKPTGVVLAQRISESEEVAFLMQQAQEILGKTISPALSSTLLAAYDDYGLPVEVLLMLLSYVKSIGKTGTQYIDAVAKNWAEEEIFTHNAADQKLRQLSEIAQAWRKLETIFGMSHRSPSSREEQYTNRWILQWHFSLEMIREAYERCVDATGKLSLSYMNKILERWQKNNITTVQQAQAEQTERNAKRSSQIGTERTYDIDAFDAMDFTTEPSFHKEQ